MIISNEVFISQYTQTQVQVNKKTKLENDLHSIDTQNYDKTINRVQVLSDLRRNKIIV